MKPDELAFVNQQLAGMLKTGIPLEGALRQLCAQMRRGRLRAELEALEADLVRGLPLAEALATRKLPEFYVKMIQLGARTNDLPGILTLVADYYQRAHLGWTRLKGLMVYPLLVLLASLGLSAFVAVIFTALVSGDPQKLKKLGRRFEPHTYPGAGHGFLRQQEDRDGANLRASKEAWPRTIGFLRRYLK